MTDAEGLNAMARYNHVAATYENSNRDNTAFVESTIQSGDVANGGLANPDEWITKEDLLRIFYGVLYILSESMNHMTAKSAKLPTPRCPIFLRVDSEKHTKTYVVFKERAHAHYPVLSPQSNRRGPLLRQHGKPKRGLYLRHDDDQRSYGEAVGRTSTESRGRVKR